MNTIKMSTSELYLNLILTPGAYVYGNYNQTVCLFLEQDAQDNADFVEWCLSEYAPVPCRHNLVRTQRNLDREILIDVKSSLLFLS